jgi:hypothetical protein
MDCWGVAAYGDEGDITMGEYLRAAADSSGANCDEGKREWPLEACLGLLYWSTSSILTSPSPSPLYSAPRLWDMSGDVSGIVGVRFVEDGCE